MERLKRLSDDSSVRPKALRGFARDLAEAVDDGALDERPVLQALLKGVAKSLKTGAGGNKSSHTLSPNEYAFYSVLLSTGGSWVAEFVATHLGGPHVDTVRRLRNNRVISYEYGDEETVVKQQVARAADLLAKQKLPTKKGIISEDGSALLDYLEAHPNKDGAGVDVWGLGGGPVKVTTVQGLGELLRTTNSATTFYPYLWVPLAPGAKAVPLMVVCHDNTKKEMSLAIMAKRWRLLWKCCAEAGLEPVAHYGDGDPRVRQLTLWLGTKGKAKYRVDHPLMCLHVRFETVVLDDGREVEIAISAGIDPMHVHWRTFRQYLDVKRTLNIGGLFAAPTHLERFAKSTQVSLGINHSHLNFNNKTNFPGLLKVSDHKLDKYGAVVPAHRIRKELKQHAGARTVEGDLLYIEFLNKMVAITWVKCRTPKDLVHDLVWVVLFCLLWEESILDHKGDAAKNKPSMATSCLTRPTLDDIQIYCQETILGIVRQQAEDPSTTFLPDRRSSRFSEYFFGDMRMAIRGQLKFTTKAALRLMQIALTKLSAESMSDVKTVSLRKYRHNNAEEQEYRNAPEGYWDLVVQDEMEVGVSGCLEQLRALHFDPATLDKCRDGLQQLTALKLRDTRFAEAAERCEKEMRGDAVEPLPVEDVDEEEAEFPRVRGAVDDDGQGLRDEGEWQDVDSAEAERDCDAVGAVGGGAADADKKGSIMQSMMASLPDMEANETSPASRQFLKV